MDSEELKITQEACDIVNGAKAKEKRIVLWEPHQCVPLRVQFHRKTH
jgi:hypothetical protein